jgi:hypothetical protein
VRLDAKNILGTFETSFQRLFEDEDGVISKNLNPQGTITVKATFACKKVRASAHAHTRGFSSDHGPIHRGDLPPIRPGSAGPTSLVRMKGIHPGARQRPLQTSMRVSVLLRQAIRRIVCGEQASVESPYAREREIAREREGGREGGRGR